MISKKILGIVIVIIGVSLVTAGCTKGGNNSIATGQGEVAPSTESMPEEPEEPEPESTEKPVGHMQDVSNPVVLLETSMGNITIELFEKDAPISVKNFLDYVNEGFYNGTIFHRVIPNFVIQGGGFTEDMEKKSTHIPIQNEAKNGLSNIRGTLAMARTSIINSATSQFFINLKDNLNLDHQNESDEGYGYCVFGKVIEGMDVVDMISRVPTARKWRYENVPIKPVIIKSARVL